MSAVLIITLLPAFLLLPLVVKILAQGSLRLIGWSLQCRTSKRRELIVSRVRTEEEASQADLRGPAEAEEDEDWEQIEGHAAGTAPNGELPREAEWEGIIGFFHPFWSVTRPRRPGLCTYAAPATQEVGGNGFCGRLCEPRKSAGQRLSAWSTRATMTLIDQP
jgi:hypothetical protein